MNPRRTGIEMKLTTKPRRAMPAAKAMTPTQIARAAVVCTKAELSPVTMPPTIAADSAAVAASAPVTSRRDEPSAA